MDKRLEFVKTSTKISWCLDEFINGDDRYLAYVETSFEIKGDFLEIKSVSSAFYEGDHTKRIRLKDISTVTTSSGGLNPNQDPNIKNPVARAHFTLNIIGAGIMLTSYSSHFGFRRRNSVEDPALSMEHKRRNAALKKIFDIMINELPMFILTAADAKK
ncbi:hypothetical protein MK805_06390 [Shimazuella sp. AN120528]|uniref:hypothetical protein n=1 Tax=Shimazuella soli TaxID=1892854 RepID=UPI001F106DE8|nr:hypothetical protein [Shimazuella soli]MCH5584597.1 hypothetical protein [Shimazuella soli]